MRMASLDKLKGGPRYERMERPSVGRKIIEAIQKRRMELACALMCVGVLGLGVAEHNGVFHSASKQEAKQDQEPAKEIKNSEGGEIISFDTNRRQGYSDGVFRPARGGAVEDFAY